MPWRTNAAAPGKLSTTRSSRCSILRKYCGEPNGDNRRSPFCVCSGPGCTGAVALYGSRRWPGTRAAASDTDRLLRQLFGVIASGETFHVRQDWVPALGLNLSFMLDGLSLLFALLISGVGSLILIYAS